MTDELAKSNLAVNLAEIKRHKRGDIRVDGRIFWEYNKACRNGERWVAVATFKHYSKLAKEAGQKGIKITVKRLHKFPRLGGQITL